MKNIGILRLRHYTGPFQAVIALMVIFLLFAGRTPADAQQLPVFTQFMFNSYLFNPAEAGTHNFYQVRMNSRFQWLGITDAPQTNSLSVYGPHGSKNMGFGGYIFNDVTGPSSRNGLYGTYAYNLKVTDLVRFSMGLSGGIIQNRVDGSRITLLDPSDQVLLNAVSSDLSPDATVGLYLYSPTFYVGLAAHQLFGNTIRLFENDNGLNKLKTHYYLTGGYRFSINDGYCLEPAVLVMGSLLLPIQAEFSLKAHYQSLLWLGVSVRTEDAVSFLVGYTHENKFHFGYSYDMSFSQIRHHNTGSHEIFLGMRFNPIKN